MSYFVYNIQRQVDRTYYKGITTDYIRKLSDHNQGHLTYTASKILWTLIYVEEHASKPEALIRERKLKRCKSGYFEWLRDQETNILKRR